MANTPSPIKRVEVQIKVIYEDENFLYLETNMSRNTIAELGPAAFQAHLRWLFSEAGVIPRWA